MISRQESLAVTGLARGTQAGSLGAVVQNFKSVSSRQMNGLRETVGASFWQRNYWEHVVRGAADLGRIREYIQANPARWAADELNPAAPGALKSGT